MSEQTVPDRTTGPCRVSIILGTYQGEAFLEAQLGSLSAQTFGNWHLLVSDDGSTDGTRAIVAAFAARPDMDGRVTLRDGPRRGFAANFLSALCAAPPSGFYAFCDQDDIWPADKLARALHVLGRLPEETPAAYFGRTTLIDETGNEIGLSPAFAREASFANALVQSIGGGNTMVINHAARVLLQLAGPHLDVVSHDWWTYQLVSGAGGTVCYDPAPCLHYRQHGQNLFGKNRGLGAHLIRAWLLSRGRLGHWTDRNIRALRAVSDLLTPGNRATLEAFAAVKTASLPKRMAAFRKSGVYRQTLLGNLGLAAAVVFGWL